MNHLVGVAHKAVGHLRHMYQSVLVDTDVDEGSKVGDVRHDAWQDHPRHQVVDLLDIRVELKLLQLLARIATGFLQFLHDVGERRQANLLRHILIDIDACTLVLIGDEVADGATAVLRHLLHDGIALRMHGTVV